MSSELCEYIGKNWNEIPIQLRWIYIKSLYDFTNGNDINLNYNASINIRGYIYYQYMIFMEQNYFVLNKVNNMDMIEGTDDKKYNQINEGLFDRPYDLETIMKYILIPKYTYYNTSFCSKWSLTHNNKQWGDDKQFNYRDKFSFLSQFNGIPLHSKAADNAFFERFFEYLFTEQGVKYWSEFIGNKSNINDKQISDFLKGATNDIRSMITIFGKYINTEFLEKIRLISVINNAIELDKLDENIQRLKKLQPAFNKNNKAWIEFDTFKNPIYFNL
eukprot:474625_1